MGLGNVLFIPWPSWVKLSFILGCLSVLDMLFAFGVKYRNGRSALKHDHMALECAERGEIQTSCDSDEIPFGIKALEQEPAIEGVWNARTATPLHTPTGSRGSSPRLGPPKKWYQNKRASSFSSVSRLDIEDQSPTTSLPVQTGPPAHIQQPLTKRKKANSITISYSGPSTRLKDDTKCTLCDSDFAGLSLSRDSEELPTKLRIQPSTHRTGSLRRRFVIGGRSTAYASEISLREEDQSAIDRMDAHRRLHSAEHGQLMPRPRRHTTELPDKIYHEPEMDESNSALRTLSWPARETSIRLGQKAPQKAERKVSPPSVPHHASVEGEMPVKVPPSAWTRRTQEQLNGKLSENRPILDN